LGHEVKHKCLILCIMRKQRTHYDKAFKENAVKLSFERSNISELAHELGIAPVLLYRWRKEFSLKGEACFPGNGNQSVSDEAKRIADLEKRLYDAETERDILKKALSIISKSGR
jgi:transposase